MSLAFYSKGIDFKMPKPRKAASWIKAAITHEKKVLTSLSYIFCSDAYLQVLNRKFLHHTTLTDIITFDYSEGNGRIEGEIFISIPRVKENALKFKTSFNDELHRVLIHGVLHLSGYNDKKATEKALMRKKEDAYLSLR